jgi:hypothetical protein
MIALYIFIAVLIICIFLANYTFLYSKDGDGKIVIKQFIAAHDDTTLEYDVVLKMTMPVIYHYDDEWIVSICIDNLTNNISKDDLIGSISVTESYYNYINIGTIVKVKYTKNRIWKSLNIQKIY